MTLRMMVPLAHHALQPLLTRLSCPFLLSTSPNLRSLLFHLKVAIFELEMRDLALKSCWSCGSALRAPRLHVDIDTCDFAAGAAGNFAW